MSEIVKNVPLNLDKIERTILELGLTMSERQELGPIRSRWNERYIRLTGTISDPSQEYWEGEDWECAPIQEKYRQLKERLGLVEPKLKPGDQDLLQLALQSIEQAKIKGLNLKRLKHLKRKIDNSPSEIKNLMEDPHYLWNCPD